MRLDIKSFALACALIWGLGLMLITWWIILFDGSSSDPTLIGQVYRGYSLSLAGSLVGLIWGLIDGLIGGAIFAGLYNLLVSRFAPGKNA